MSHARLLSRKTKAAPAFAAFAFAGIAAALSGGCANTPDEPAAPPAYSLQLRGDAAFDLAGAAQAPGFDTVRNAWWLVGNGASVSLQPLPAADPAATAAAVAAGTAPATVPGPVVLYLRTTASPSLESHVPLLRIRTPEHCIDIRESAPSDVQISRTDAPNNQQTLRNTDLVRLSREGTRVKAVLSADFLHHYAPHGASVTWHDTSPGALPSRAFPN